MPNDTTPTDPTSFGYQARDKKVDLVSAMYLLQAGAAAFGAAGLAGNSPTAVAQGERLQAAADACAELLQFIGVPLGEAQALWEGRYPELVGKQPTDAQAAELRRTYSLFDSMRQMASQRTGGR